MTRGLGGQSPSNVAQHLKGIDFPCSKKDLVAHARKNQAEEPVLKALEAFPEREYANMAEVMEGFGESRDTEDDLMAESEESGKPGRSHT
jgi:hypothetical protein